jgi:hypothetical protein
MADKTSRGKMTEQQIRAELGNVLDQLAHLPSDAIADRARLRERQAELGDMLRAIDVDGVDEIKDRWSRLAGSKTADETKPVIVSPNESGGFT